MQKVIPYCLQNQIISFPFDNEEENAAQDALVSEISDLGLLE
jgi:hypothetical protein